MFQKDFYRCLQFESSSTIRIRRFSLVAEPETGSSGDESAPKASGRKSTAFNFCIIHARTLVTGCYALSQVTNHAPISPRSTPSSGLDTANQNGIISLNEMIPRATFAV